MGLNFQTCTIINSTDRFSGTSEKLFVKNDFLFEKGKVKSIYKKEGADWTPATIKVTIPTESGNYRLDVFVKYDGAEPAYAANAVNTYKGVPFWVEFSGGTATATSVANQIKKDSLFLINKNILTTAADKQELTLTAATEYVRFSDVKIVKIEDDGSETVTSTFTPEPGDEGTNGFGTYSHIVKDLRLPTATNTGWTALRQDEAPVVGALYNQYIIEYCAPAINEGTMFVGHRGMNWTTHVFWVNKDIAGTWETALKAIDPDGGSLGASNVAVSIEDRISELESKSEKA